MSGETRNFGEKFGSQGIPALYPYSRYNGASTNEVDLYGYILFFFNMKVCCVFSLELPH